MNRPKLITTHNHLLISIFILTLLLITSVSARKEQEQVMMAAGLGKDDNSAVQELEADNKWRELNAQVQTLDEDFIKNFVGYYHVQNSRLLQAFNDETMASQLNLTVIRTHPGNYLTLLAKVYLYNTLPKSQLTGYTWSTYASQSRYLLAYFYFRIAAEKYENAEAYYYLALLDYYKLTPHETVVRNLEKEVGRVAEAEGFHRVGELRYDELLDYLKSQRFYSVQQNLFMSSLMGHPGASLTLAYMYKTGIGLDKTTKNCTTSLSYYLSIIKQSYVDFYQFRSSYPDNHNFQKQLYTHRKVVFENQQNAGVVSGSEFFDSETIRAMYELAESYFIGRDGFEKDYVKAAELYGKLAAQDHKNSMAMLGMCYFKGQGVPIDRKRAKLLFQQSTKVSISQAMLIVMDYFQIQSEGNRGKAIRRMKQIYTKKKQHMNPILKYLFATLVIKGDVEDVKTDDAVLLLGSAAKEGHLMAKITMGLLFADGIDVNFDCARAIGYFSQQALSHPFFMDKYYMAKQGLKNSQKTFALIKYLQLTLVGDTNSFINALYVLEIEQQSGLGMSENSWNIKTATENPLYKKLTQLQIVPDIYTYFQKQYTFLGQRPMRFSTLQRLFEGNPQIVKEHAQYIKKKVIKVCAVTKQNSLMNFYEYKTGQHKSSTLLEMISNGEAEKLHVLESRYLLGQYYHKRSFETLQKGKDNTKQQYKALQEYKRATGSQIVGKVLFYIEEFMLNPIALDLEDELFQFAFVNDLLTYTFVLSILIFFLYYKRSKRLDEIHQKELEKRQEENRVQRQEEEVRRRFKEAQRNEEQNKGQSQERSQEKHQFMQEDTSQPQILQQRPPQGYRIGSSHQDDDPLVLRQAYNYEQYLVPEQCDKKDDQITPNHEKTELKEQ